VLLTPSPPHRATRLAVTTPEEGLVGILICTFTTCDVPEASCTEVGVTETDRAELDVTERKYSLDIERVAMSVVLNSTAAEGRVSSRSYINAISTYCHML